MRAQDRSEQAAEELLAEMGIADWRSVAYDEPTSSILDNAVVHLVLITLMVAGSLAVVAPRIEHLVRL